MLHNDPCQKAKEGKTTVGHTGQAKDKQNVNKASVDSVDMHENPQPMGHHHLTRWSMQTKQVQLQTQKDLITMLTMDGMQTQEHPLI